MEIGSVGEAIKKNKGRALMSLTRQQLIESHDMAHTLENAIIRALGRVPAEERRKGLFIESDEE